ncbi:EAL domain-containing protein [Psychrobacillus antarcticus]|uniref:EAL domain-containing protein n=1 Tax=Psychrobacillus antarcticus TaxID=2879115 RepID=UPI002407992D|nr:EAL domain-containing protein [Psychrobacillus antarcticus]
MSVIRQLRDLGMEVELDDFGTGFSSLKYLKGFPINCIKIDQSFVKDALISETSKAIINGTIHLAHELGFTIFEEGIEEKAQLNYLIDEGCDGFQGYLLGKPQPLSYYQKGEI